MKIVNIKKQKAEQTHFFITQGSLKNFLCEVALTSPQHLSLDTRLGDIMLQLHDLAEAGILRNT